MMSRRIRRERFQMLDSLGLDAICDLYIDKASGVRDLMARIFKPSRSGQRPGAADFYSWLDVRGYRSEWKQTVELKPIIKADEALEFGVAAMDNPYLMRGAKAEMSRRLWEARRDRSSKG